MQVEVESQGKPRYTGTVGPDPAEAQGQRRGGPGTPSGEAQPSGGPGEVRGDPGADVVLGQDTKDQTQGGPRIGGGEVQTQGRPSCRPSSCPDSVEPQAQGKGSSRPWEGSGKPKNG